MTLGSALFTAPFAIAAVAICVGAWVTRHH